MDIRGMMNKLPQWAKKYRYVLLILLSGIVLMLLPGKEGKAEVPEVLTVTEPSEDSGLTSEMLENIISEIKGAGKAQVLLTYSAGEQWVYQSDEHTVTNADSSTKEVKTVIVSDGSRKEEALVTQILGPKYLGAVVVCQGAEDPEVRLAVSDAVAKATGLGADKISVLKMK